MTIPSDDPAPAINLREFSFTENSIQFLHQIICRSTSFGTIINTKLTEECNIIQFAGQQGDLRTEKNNPLALANIWLNCRTFQFKSSFFDCYFPAHGVFMTWFYFSGIQVISSTGLLWPDLIFRESKSFFRHPFPFWFYDILTRF